MIETMNFIKKQEDINTGEADVAAALESEHKEENQEEWEKNFWDTFNRIEALEKTIQERQDQEKAAEKEAETQAFNERMRELEALISEGREKGWISDKSRTELEVEEAARIGRVYDAIEKVYGPTKDPFQKIVAFIPNQDEQHSFDEARAKAYQELFGVSEAFDKAREAAIRDINSPEAQSAFAEAKSKAEEYIDKFSGKEAARLAGERVHSPEFLIAMTEVKNLAQQRLSEIIAEAEKPTVAEMAEDRKKEFADRIAEIKNEVENRKSQM